MQLRGSERSRYLVSKCRRSEFEYRNSQLPQPGIYRSVKVAEVLEYTWDNDAEDEAMWAKRPNVSSASREG